MLWWWKCNDKDLLVDPYLLATTNVYVPSRFIPLVMNDKQPRKQDCLADYFSISVG